MNFLDVLIFIGFLIAFGLAFMAGFWRVLSFLIALWVGLIGADLFGRTLGSFIERSIPGIASWTADFWGYLIVLAIGTVIVLYLLLRSFRIFRLRSGRSLEFRGGTPVIIATMALSLLVALVSVTVLIRVSDRTIRQLPAEQRASFLSNQFRESSLAPTTLEMGGYVYDATGRWVPGGTPSLLAPTNQR